jgi:hypothetical protein
MRQFLHIPLFLLVFSFSARAAWPDERTPGDDKKTKAKREDSTQVANLEDITGDSPDTTLMLFPSNDLYATWDTSVIHPYSFAECFKADSTVLCLSEYGDGGFIMPSKGNITSDFGWRRYRPHYGTDIDLETGDTVVAAFDGMVRIAKPHAGGYGNVIIIRHNNGLETVYGHLSKILVEAGQNIKAGELIGLGGNTGRSYGSHLHFEIRYLGQALDAEDFIDFTKGELKNFEFTLRKIDVENKYDLRALRSRHKRDIGLARYEAKNGIKKGGVYRVRKGDNLGKIAKRYHTTVKAICKKNGFKQTHVLRIGEKIKL